MTKRKQNAKRGGSGGSGNRLFYALLGAVVIAGGVWLLTAGAGGEETSGAARPVSVADTEVEADPSVGVVSGSPDAPVEIVEFADFRCPHCRTFNSLTGRLLRSNYAGPEGPVRWISYEFPIWPESVAPAVAARCAEEQGRYWQMHDLLFARQDEWMRDDSPADRFLEYAERLGLDVAAFESCLEEREPLREVMASRKYGETLGVRGTPTLFFNGTELDIREADYGNLERMIRQAAGAEDGAE